MRIYWSHWFALNFFLLTTLFNVLWLYRSSILRDGYLGKQWLGCESNSLYLLQHNHWTSDSDTNHKANYKYYYPNWKLCEPFQKLKLFQLFCLIYWQCANIMILFILKKYFLLNKNKTLRCHNDSNNFWKTDVLHMLACVTCSIMSSKLYVWNRNYFCT